MKEEVTEIYYFQLIERQGSHHGYHDLVNLEGTQPHLTT